MRKKAKLEILESVLGPYSDNGDELLFKCPSCEHRKKKFSANLNKNKFQCWVCGYSGHDVSRIISKFGNPEQKRKWLSIGESYDINDFYEIFSVEEQEEEQVRLPAEFRTLATNKKQGSSRLALKYLQERGITMKQIKLWRLGYCVSGEYEGRIIIPSFGKDGACNYFTARTYKGDWLRYKNPKISRNIVFNELSVNWKESISLTEGPFDAIKAGYNSVPLLGSSLTEKSVLFQKIIKNDVDVYLALDADAEQKELKIAMLLMKYGINVFKIDTSDYEDVAVMPCGVFEERKRTAEQLELNDCILRMASIG